MRKRARERERESAREGERESERESERERERERVCVCERDRGKREGDALRAQQHMVCRGIL
jgi:hypothetical protein